MRLTNVVIGVLLAIVLAYIHDSAVEPFSATGKPQTIVNWSVLAQAVGDLGTWLRQQWDQLVNHAHSA